MWVGSVGSFGVGGGDATDRGFERARDELGRARAPRRVRRASRSSISRRSLCWRLTSHFHPWCLLEDVLAYSSYSTSIAMAPEFGGGGLRRRARGGREVRRGRDGEGEAFLRRRRRALIAEMTLPV